LLVKPTPRNVNLGNGRFAMFNKERDISGRDFSLNKAIPEFPAATVAHPDPDDAIHDIRNVESPTALGNSVLGVKMAC
jgi:hypothetical protein